jgi:hypothetical protein
MYLCGCVLFICMDIIYFIFIVNMLATFKCQRPTGSIGQNGHRGPNGSRRWGTGPADQTTTMARPIRQQPKLRYPHCDPSKPKQVEWVAVLDCPAEDAVRIRALTFTYYCDPTQHIKL